MSRSSGRRVARPRRLTTCSRPARSASAASISSWRRRRVARWGSRPEIDRRSPRVAGSGWSVSRTVKCFGTSTLASRAGATSADMRRFGQGEPRSVVASRTSRPNRRRRRCQRRPRCLKSRQSHSQAVQSRANTLGLQRLGLVAVLAGLGFQPRRNGQFRHRVWPKPRQC